MHGRLNQRGFSLVELLIVVVVIGIIAAIAVLRLMDALDRGRQRRTLADMRNIATANGTMRVDTGSYAMNLAVLSPTYMEVAPVGDGWGTPFGYTTGADAYTITSFGSDGVAGPAPPVPWVDSPYELDLIISSGSFLQAPEAGASPAPGPKKKTKKKK